MRRQMQLSWALKISVLVAFLLLVTSGVVATASFTYARQVLVENLGRKGWGMAHAAAALAAQPLATGNRPLLGQLVTGMAGERDVVYVAVLDASGRALAHSDPAQVGQKKDDLQTFRALAARQDYIQYYHDARGRATVLDLVSPIRDGQGTLVGYMRLGMDMRPLQRQLNAMLAFAGMAAAGMILASCFTTLYLVRRHLDQPVRALQQATLAAAAGDFSAEINKEWPDDLGTLAHSLQLVKVLLANIVGPLRDGLADLRATAEALLRACERNEEGPVPPGELRPAIERLTRLVERLHALTLQVKT